MQSQPLREHGSWDLPIHMDPKSEVLTMIGCLHGGNFGGESWDLCCKLGLAKH